MSKTSIITSARLSRGASTIALAGALWMAGATAAMAQDAAAEDTANEDIVVSGYAAALDSATAEKRQTDQIIESISAEDIGRLPDASIGEAIARLPGITSQRLNGRANNIAIRGFGPDFSQTLLNGREQTSTGDNRAVEFDQYPSEVVNQVVVYKSPTASLVGQGLVGTVDIRTIRPLENGGRQILAVGGRGTLADLGALNSGSNRYGYRLNGTFVDQFADDTMGIALSASYVDEPYQLQEFNAWGYNNVGGNALIGGSKSYVTSTQLQRLGLNGTLQWEPNDNMLFTIDAFYSHFNDDQIKRGIELPLGFFAFGTQLSPTGQTAAGGQIVSGTFTNVEGVVRNDVYDREADLYSLGFNSVYDAHDGWKLTLDLGYSRTSRSELSIESYSGTGYGTGVGATDTIAFNSGPSGTTFRPTLDYSNPALIRLTDPLGWGGSRIQAGYWNDRQIEDELYQFRGEVEREFDGGALSSVQLGMNYTTRDKSLNPDEFFIGLRGGASSLPIPTAALLSPTNLDYLGLGPIVSYDPRGLVADGTYVLSPNTSNDIPAKAYLISEDLWTTYLQANINSELAGGELTGNIGVQAIHTDQNSSGLVFTNGIARAASRGDSYWDVLPSINLSLRYDSGLVLRFAAAREIQRPRLDQMRIATSIGIDTSQSAPFYLGNGGNPLLRPIRANAVDFNVEQYFGRGGIVALQLFYKDIKSFIDNTRVAFDFAGYPLPTGVAVPSTQGFLDSTFNTGGGSFMGAELGATVPFGNLSESLDGFGFTGGVGYSRSRVRTTSGAISQIPGYSKWTANGTLYFERSGFNVRGSARYRSTFLGDFTGFGGSPTRRQALTETIIDGQIGYDFQPGSALEGLSLYVQGQNLTDERFASVANTATPLQVIDYQIYGRRFLAGFTFKF